MPVQNYLYPFDATGLLVSNRITGELKTVNQPAGPNLAFVVPAAAPFFKDGLVVRNGTQSNSPLMVEGVDYILTHHFIEASLGTGKPVYGSIAFLNRSFSGTVRLRYQTVGGMWTLNDTGILQALTNSLYNILTVTWGNIVSLPATFPPTVHNVQGDDITGWADIIAPLVDIKAAIDTAVSDPTQIAQLLANHLAEVNAHTAAQVGLGNVPNYGIGTSLEAQQGLVNNKLMTPMLTALTLAALGAGKLQTPRNIELTGEVVGNANFDGSADVDIVTSMADIYKFIDNKVFAEITAGTGVEDPDTTIKQFCLTRHANSPDNTSTYYWFIVTFGSGSSLGGVNRKSQLAVEFVAGRAPRIATRAMSSASIWSIWDWVSNHQLNKVDGRRYGTAYVDPGNPGVDADFDAIIDTQFRAAVASVNLNGLTRGTWLVDQVFDNAVTVVPGVLTPRTQIAVRRDATGYYRDNMYQRNFNGTSWSTWIRLDRGAAGWLFDTNLNILVDDGYFRQNDNITYTLLSLGYPVNALGTLTVLRTAGIGGGTAVRQQFHASNSLEMYERVLTNLALFTWSDWVKVRMADGSVPLATLPNVDLAHGGTGGTDAATARAGLELQNGAVTNIIVSPTDPTLLGPVPVGTLWLKPTV
jgi:hypothetical protein